MYNSFTVDVTQGPDDDYLPERLPVWMQIERDATEATLSIELPDDAVDEPDGLITVAIHTVGSSYKVGTASASLVVHDNDDPGALTAEFIGVPAAHDAQSLFRFELRFSEDFPRAGLRSTLQAALQVTNGAVREFRRTPSGQNRNWTIGVRPDSHAPVTIELPATTDCNAANAVCTTDGRPLSNSLSATVTGPATLTAAFAGMPSFHDGTSLIRFELRFSEEFQQPAGLLERLRAAFRVTNGTVREVARATPGRSRVWEIGIQPNSRQDVTVELPATTDCSAAAAVCTKDGRPLSNSLSATLRVPPALTAEFAGMPSSHNADGLDPLRAALQWELPRGPRAAGRAEGCVPGDQRDGARGGAGDRRPEWTLDNRRAAGHLPGRDGRVAGHHGLHRRRGGLCVGRAATLQQHVGDHFWPAGTHRGIR